MGWRMVAGGSEEGRRGEDHALGARSCRHLIPVVFIFGAHQRGSFVSLSRRVHSISRERWT